MPTSKNVRHLAQTRREVPSPKRLILLALTLCIVLGFLVLIAGVVTQMFGVDAARLFTLGKVLIALPMWAGVVVMFSFVCRM